MKDLLGGAGSAVPTRQRQVEEELLVLTTTIDRMSDIVERLENGLSPVLTELYPPDEKEKKEDVMVLVPLASRTRSIRKKASALADYLNQMLERLEL